MTTHLVGAARGNPYDPQSVSGVPRHLFDALARRYTLVDRIDTRPSLFQTPLLALTSFSPQRRTWLERYFKSALAFAIQSRNSQRRLARIAQPYDAVVQVYGLFRTIGAPYVMYIDNTHRQSIAGWPDWNPLRGPQLARWLADERQTYTQALHCFTMGTPAADSLVRDYGVRPERVTVVGGGVNFDRLPTPDLTSAREPLILFVGREFVRKGGDTLLAAFRLVRAELPQARLVLVGSDAVPPEPGVEVPGALGDRAALAALYRQAQVFCLPTRFEPYGLVLTEAMAHGLPVVSTLVNAVPEIVLHERTGLLVPPDDVPALAAALLRLLRDPAYAARLGQAGYARVSAELTWDQVVGRMAPVLDRLDGLRHGQTAAVRPNQRAEQEVGAP